MPVAVEPTSTDSLTQPIPTPRATRSPAAPRASSLRAGPARLLLRAVHAEGALGADPEAAGGDLGAAVVADAVGALVELLEGALEPRLDRIEAVGDPDVVEAADRLGRPVADPLAEADPGAALGRPLERGEAVADLGQLRPQLGLDLARGPALRLPVPASRCFILPIPIRLPAPPQTYRPAGPSARAPPPAAPGLLLRGRRPRPRRRARAALPARRARRAGGTTGRAAAGADRAACLEAAAGAARLRDSRAEPALGDRLSGDQPRRRARDAAPRARPPGDRPVDRAAAAGTVASSPGPCARRWPRPTGHRRPGAEQLPRRLRRGARAATPDSRYLSFFLTESGAPNGTVELTETATLRFFFSPFLTAFLACLPSFSSMVRRSTGASRCRRRSPPACRRRRRRRRRRR